MWHFVVLALVLLTAGAYSIFLRVQPPPHTLIKIGDVVIPVRVANTPFLQHKGWSDAPTMGDVQGMLFLFNSAGSHPMVMRDMQFPLDIVWLNGTQIVYFAPNLAPEDGRAESELTIYKSPVPANMVLELPAGFMAKHNVHMGDSITIVNSGS